MFGNNKPFGTASAFGASTFGNTSTPFGQNTTAFGAKPATNNVFGSTGFGVQTASTPMSGGLFGTSTPTTGAGLFGQPTPAFGAPASTSSGAFGGFGAASTSGGLFGSTTPSTQSTGGLFGSTSTSAFGTPRPAFGSFGATNAGSGLFGQNTSTGTGLFGSTGVGGFSSTVQTGTTVKFNPPTGTDTMMKGGVSTSIGTRHQCITCMKEYENKSLEELRVEDYAANRKGGASTTGLGFGATQPAAGGLFGGSAAAASTSAFTFGNTTQSKPLFGTTGMTNTFGSTNTGLFGQTAQNQNAGLFGKSVGFGAPSTSTAPAFSFGGTNNTSLFGQNNQQKPLFGQSTGTTGLFGSPATTQSTGFGTSTGFGGFGTTNQSGSLFGAKPTGFGTTNTTTTNTFSFGNTGSGGLFGQKTTAPAFGSTGFGTQTSSFGAFGTTPSTGTNLFGQNKPATSGFGTTTNLFGGGLGTGFGTPSTFSMGGLGSNTSTGLFGNTTANKPTGFTFGNTGSTGFNFGSTNPSTSAFNFGGTATQMPANDLNNSAALQQIQQQILALTANPFGDSPLFRNPIQDSTRETEVLKPTNPSAQKALLSDSQYKVDLLPTAKIKPKPWSPAPTGKVFLFDGLEDEEPSLGAAAFVPKRSIKKLVLKNIGNTNSSLTLTSDVSTNQPTRIDVSISLKSQQNQMNKISGEPVSSTTPLTSDVSKILKESDTDTRLSIAGGEQQPMLSRSVTLEKEATSPKAVQDILDDSIAALHTNKPRFTKQTFNVWSDSTDEVRNFSLNESLHSSSDVDTDPKSHPTGLILTKSSYYTVPSKDEMIPFVDINNNCFVENFTIGRKGYGKVVFPGVTNVYGLNLDAIVCFQNKEITVYPDDEKKPPIGEELNKRAEVTLENVWPTDKTSHTLIKDQERLDKMGYKEKIKNCTVKLGATFIDYIPETGSWVFEVEHFSKYGLEDSDEEMDVTKPLDNKAIKNQQLDSNGMIKTSQPKQILVQKPTTLTSQDQDMEITVPQMQTQHLDFMSESSLVDFNKPVKPLFSSVIDSERIQDMKASLFEDDMDDVWDSPIYCGKKDPFIHQQKEMLSFGTPSSLHSRVYDSSSKEVLKKMYNFEADVEPILQSPFKKLAETGIHNSLSNLSIESSKPPDWYMDLPVVQNNYQLIPSRIKPMPNVLSAIFLKPLKESVLYNKQHLIADAGYFMGRSFRVGWAASGVFTSLNAPEEDQSQPVDQILCKILKPYKAEGMANSKLGFTVALNRIPLNSFETESGNKIQDNLVEALNLQLKNSVSTSNEEGAPLFVSKPGVESTHELALMFEKQLKDADPLAFDTLFTKQCSFVWNLLVSLWGNVPGLNFDENKANYIIQMARREALSKWLIKTTEQDLNKKIADLPENGYLKKILLCLTGRQTKTAIEVAQKHKDFRLSLLLAQAEGTSMIRKLILRQIITWEQRDVCKFISSDRIAIYALLSGIMFWENKHYSVNCCQNLNWKQALSLHLWYHCNSNASIQEVVSKYDESFMKKCSFPPYPSYLENSAAYYDDSVTEYDTTYHLLKLYCDRSHRLDLLLMPETYSTDHLDYRLSWFLHLALSSIGYNIPLELSSTINLNFAAQLEGLNLWQWAIFVVLHHSDSNLRIKTVKDILLRHVTLEANEKMSDVETFLVKSLLVPSEWIFEAKAIKANNVGNRTAEAWYLLKAGFWNKSHNIVIKYLATRAVINEDYDFLLKYLNELLPPERSCTIQDWCSGGQVYLDYIHICKVVQEVLNNKANAYDLEKFTPEVVSLCKRLSSIPILSMEDSLSVAEMAKKTATILRSICILQATRTQNTNYLTTLTQAVKNLPMPYDYKVPENRFAAHCFLDIVTAAK